MAVVVVEVAVVVEVVVTRWGGEGGLMSLPAVSVIPETQDGVQEEG